MKLDKSIDRPAITEAVQAQILFDFNPESHELVGIRTAIVVGWAEGNGKMRVDKKIDVVVEKSELEAVMTKEQIEALQDVHATVMQYGLGKV